MQLFHRINVNAFQLGLTLTHENPFPVGDVTRNISALFARQSEVEGKAVVPKEHRNVGVSGLSDERALNALSGHLRPAPELHLTVLVIEGKPRDVYFTGALEYAFNKWRTETAADEKTK